MPVLILGIAALGCYLFYVRGLPWSTPGRVALLRGTAGVWLGVAGVALALSVPSPYRACLLIGWLCLWFAAGLAELRASAVTDGAVIGGVIPYSDAWNYLQESSLLTEGQNMTAWGARRPLADTYLAGLLYVAGGRVTLAVALAGIFTAIAMGLAAIELRNRLGVIAATAWTWLLLFYCRRYVGEMMSEQAGLALGALAVALLVQSFGDKIRSSLCLGLFMLSLALCARAGTLVVLPALWLAAGWHWRRNGLTRVLLAAGLSVAAAFALNFAFVKMLGPPQGKIVSNYHNVAYGIIFGSDWHQAASDIPNYNNMDESAQAAEVYRRIAAAVRAHPAVLLRGPARAWLDFFGGSYQGLGAFSFLRNPRIEVILLGLSGLSLFWSFAPRDPLYPMILAAGLGIILSVPFLPPRDADLMRAYAATIPLLSLIPVFSVTIWGGWLARLVPGLVPGLSPQPFARGPVPETPSHLNGWALPYLLVLIAVPLFARFVVPSAPAVRMVERGTEATLTVALAHTSWIELTPAPEMGRNAPDRISPAAFKNGIYGSFRDLYPKQAALLDSFSRPGLILAASGSSGLGYLVLNGGNPKKGSLITVHGRMVASDSDYAPCFVEDGVAHH